MPKQGDALKPKKGLQTSLLSKTAVPMQRTIHADTGSSLACCSPLCSQLKHGCTRCMRNSMGHNRLDCWHFYSAARPASSVASAPCARLWLTRQNANLGHLPLKALPADLWGSGGLQAAQWQSSNDSHEFQIEMSSPRDVVLGPAQLNQHKLKGMAAVDCGLIELYMQGTLARTL